MERIKSAKYFVKLVRSGIRRVLRRRYNGRKDRCSGVIFTGI
jgi:hypothetical protein